MSSEAMCQVSRSWVDVGSCHTSLVVRFINFTASVRNILDTCSFITGGIRTLKPSKRVAADPHLRPGGHWNRQTLETVQKSFGV
jgi:hypothetical protein